MFWQKVEVKKVLGGDDTQQTQINETLKTGLIDDNFNENEENMSGSDVSGSDSDASERVSLDGLNMDSIEVDELCDSDDSGRLDSTQGSDSDGQNWSEFNLENDMSNPRLKACKYGYKAGCRRIVGLDGCFLKGYYGGYLHAAVGIDANNGIYPLAYAAVESENQASWLWFLELLAIDLEIGLVEAICILFPNAKTRYCVRHLYANFKKAGFRTKELKDLLWKAARESTTKEFEDAIDELRKTNQHTYDWLKEKNLTHWSRSHFSIRGHSDMLMILEARGKPILTMMEIIRIKIMCVPSHAGGDKYQVECGLDSQHVVDLVENSCSCKNWDLTGIPCMHALAVIHLKEEFPETYVQIWYTKQTQLQI
ncbi:uncharacterized protein LOC108485170 [Gossypium arboreum]|uniref:uncharacterized protein LOC108485170 n=1 Tax=Gossypium arboreum TaxID=29729 RepID=UPI000819764E|nr:uncharacterized protein LOC108485170 [Gossypium arboreum]